MFMLFRMIILLSKPRELRKQRCAEGFLETLIDDKKKKSSIIAAISAKTILSRVATGNLKPNYPGTKSPLAEVEESIVAVCIQMGKIR